MMKFTKTYIPYGCYWSTPFARWQGSFSHLNSVTFAADVAKSALKKRHVPPEIFKAIYLGITIPQKHSFYGQTWLAGLIGAPHTTGPMMAQACATSARVIGGATAEIEASQRNDYTILAVTCDRTSNGPSILYPNPYAPGARPDVENWVWDNFGCDPYANNPMIETAENVAREAGISREEQERTTLLRYQQYNQALENDAAFLHRFMEIPQAVKIGRKTVLVEEDEGVHNTTADGLQRLNSVIKNGTVTYGTQTHPADGNCGMILTSQGQAKEMSLNSDIEIQVVSFGQARSKRGFMPMAPVPASQNALEDAALQAEEITATKLHNPFAVNDIYFSQELGIALEDVNNYGSSLVWGHPQGPTGMRLTIELIEELVMKKGGFGLFAGCSAGDSAAAIVIQVEVS
ncbi:MAG: thiolase family protein [Candidatus Thorarchaeota archaeon]